MDVTIRVACQICKAFKMIEDVHSAPVGVTKLIWCDECDRERVLEIKAAMEQMQREYDMALITVTTT